MTFGSLPARSLFMLGRCLSVTKMQKTTPRQIISKDCPEKTMITGRKVPAIIELRETMPVIAKETSQDKTVKISTILIGQISFTMLVVFSKIISKLRIYF